MFIAALATAHAGIISQIGLSSGSYGIADIGYAKTPVVDQYVSIRTLRRTAINEQYLERYSLLDIGLLTEYVIENIDLFYHICRSGLIRP